MASSHELVTEASVSVASLDSSAAAGVTSFPARRLFYLLLLSCSRARWRAALASFFFLAFFASLASTFWERLAARSATSSGTRGREAGEAKKGKKKEAKAARHLARGQERSKEESRRAGKEVAPPAGEESSEATETDASATSSWLDAMAREETSQEEEICSCLLYTSPSPRD